MSQYFKKASGVIIKAGPQHDLKSLMDRFEECDINGNAIVKEVKKPSKKEKTNGK